jgi:serine/threonine protein kinase
LVSNDGAIKLADFGASKRIEAFSAQSDMMELSMRGTPYFMAPEVFEEKFGFKADIWSVGGVIYQMITGSPPWKGMGFKSPVALFMHIKSHDRPPSLPRLTECNALDFALLEKILTACFQREPSMRPSASALKSHQFLNYSIDHTPESPNLTQNHDRLPSLSPIGAAFLESPTSPSPSSDDTTNGNEALGTTLADSLCFSLTMTSPFPKLNAREPTDTSSWPDWAKRCDKVNASRKVAENKEGNPYAKKSPLTSRCLERNTITTGRKSISFRDADADSMATK